MTTTIAMFEDDDDKQKAVDDFVRPEPKRDRYGRYLITPPDGGKPQAYTRATTIAHTLDDRWAFEERQVRLTARGIVTNKAIYADVASLPFPPTTKDEKKAYKKVLDDAFDFAGGNDAARMGKALHKFIERINRGEDVDVPEPFKADTDAYKAKIAADGIIVQRDLLERIVVCHDLMVAGTFDLVIHDGKAACITDLKTGQDITEFGQPAIAMQLAIYAHGDALYNPHDDTYEAMPPVDQDTALVIHLPVGQAKCTIYELDIAAGWAAVEHAMWVRTWRKRKDLARVCTPGTSTSQPSRTESPSTTTSSPLKESTTPSDHSSTRTSRSTTKKWSGTEPSTKTKPPDEGGDADPSAIEALRAKANALTTDQRGWIRHILTQAQAAGTNLGLTNATVRRFEIFRALVHFAEFAPDDELLRAALGLVYGEEVQPAVPLGAAVAGLSIDHARGIGHIAAALHDGRYAVIYPPGGGVKLEAA